MKLTVRSPSNIALIKYWGKLGDQLPCNPSVSFTLTHAFTEMSFELCDKNSSEDIELVFFFEGLENQKFQDKIIKFILKEKEYFKNVLSKKIILNSKNTFPHSSGIASSASSMSAMVYGLLALDFKLSHKSDEVSSQTFLNLASRLSRLASGSASRSVFPGVVLWGDYKDIGTNDCAVDVSHMVDSRFLTFRDTIVIVSKNEKSVSSRAGHGLMENHPYREVRFQEARKRMDELLMAMKNYDLEAFIKIVEKDALDLHGLMMTSEPSFMLIEAKTIDCIKKLRTFRERTNIPVCFTLDAGPNLHVLYPIEYREEVVAFLTQLDLPLIHDEVGKGSEIYE